MGCKDTLASPHSLLFVVTGPRSFIAVGVAAAVAVVAVVVAVVVVVAAAVVAVDATTDIAAVAVAAAAAAVAIVAVAAAVTIHAHQHSFTCCPPPSFVLGPPYLLHLLLLAPTHFSIWRSPALPFIRSYPCLYGVDS